MTNKVELNQNRERNRKQGFTLIELLVVVSIISLLVSILLPALGRAREQARSVECLANLRRIAISVILYTHENNDYMMYTLVGGATWADYLYVTEDNTDALVMPDSTEERTRFHCPSEPAHGHYIPPRAPYHVSWSPSCDYGLNRGSVETMCGQVDAYGVETLRSCRLSSIKKQSERFLVVDSEFYFADAVSYWYRNPEKISGRVWSIDARHLSRPGEYGYIGDVVGKPNMAFVDTHAEPRVDEMPWEWDRPPW